MKRKIYNVADYVNGIRVDIQNGLVINGFWRSGTTWLQEITSEMLQAKLVFEPFDASNKSFRNCLVEIRPRREDIRFVNALMPYIANNFEKGTALQDLVNQSLRGQNIGYKHAELKRRRCLKDCLRSRVVTKFVRGSLCLRAIANTFSVPIIHISRDPRAVVSSIKKKKPSWGKNAFLDFPLVSHLMEVNDGRRDYFQRWTSDIEAIDRTDDYGRIAAYHCLTERYLEDSFQGLSCGFAHLRYEALVNEEGRNLALLLEDLGLEPRITHSNKIDIPSFTARDRYRSDRKISKDERLFGWKSSLSDHERGLVEDVVNTFGMQDRLWQE